MSAYQTQLSSPSRLTSALPGRVVIPEEVRFDEARRAWNLAIDQRPAAVAFPESPQDVAAAVLFAREFGLRVAAQGTGHGAGPLGSLEDTILLKTERSRAVAGALRRDPQAELASGQNSRRDILRRLRKRHRRGPLVDREVPRSSRLIEAPVLRDHDLAWQSRSQPTP